MPLDVLYRSSKGLIYIRPISHAAQSPLNTQHIAKTAETLLQRGKRGPLGPLARCFFFSRRAEMLIPEARARTYVSICVCGGRGVGPITHPYSYMSGLHLDPDVSPHVRPVAG